MANIINFLIAFGVGIMTDSIMDIAVFYLIFVTLRYFCGGYHAKSYGRCFFLFTVTCIGYVFLLKAMTLQIEDTRVLLASAMVILGVCICAKAPIEHENRPFTDSESRRFRKRSLQLFLIWSAVGMMSWIGRIERLSVGIACAFFIIAGYMLIKGKKSDEKENV